jgi:uncharacterized membrane protein
MNKSAFVIFAGISLITGLVVLLLKHSGIELSIFIIICVAILVGIIAAVVYAKRVKTLIKQIVFDAKHYLQLYN